MLACMSRGGSCNGHLPPMTLTLGSRTPTGAPPTGATTSPTRAGGEEDHAGVTTNSSLLLSTAKPDQHRELRAVVYSNFNFKPETYGVTLNPVPTGSPNRQILVAAGSGGPSTTAWNMCNFKKLYNHETQTTQPSPILGDQGGTHIARERNLTPTNKIPQNKSKKIIKTTKNHVKPHDEPTLQTKRNLHKPLYWPL